MSKIGRVLTTVVAIVVLSLTVSLGTAQPAAAYGSNAVYQIMFSFNCTDPVACAAAPPDNPFGPGGFWGWIELDSTTHPGAMTGGDADVVVTGCDHFRTTVPHGGADHFNLDGTWFFVGSSIATGLLVITVVVPGEGTMSLAFPSAPGHYSLHPAPQIANEIQISLIPGR
jgi:hypothetical protein